MSSVPSFAYVALAIVLLLVLGTAAPKVGGGLLILLVIGMIYAGFSRGAFSSTGVIG